MQRSTEILDAYGSIKTLLYDTEKAPLHSPTSNPFIFVMHIIFMQPKSATGCSLKRMKHLTALTNAYIMRVLYIHRGEANLHFSQKDK